ncbi:hypothetical protein WJX81_004572 [Elliptochloris bilobata]|uniref:Alpha-amylase n=1 Tax=Elliptochloris bilobata TaxID=381761 RepID=A0AAW1REH9_9CHLO
MSRPLHYSCSGRSVSVGQCSKRMRAAPARGIPARAETQQKDVQHEAPAPAGAQRVSGSLAGLLGVLFQGAQGAPGSGAADNAMPLLLPRRDADAARKNRPPASLQRIKDEAAAARRALQLARADDAAPGADLRKLLSALDVELAATSAAARGPDGAAVIARALAGLGLAAPAEAVAAELGAAAPLQDAFGGVTPEGSGFEILLQAFNWESHRERWWTRLGTRAEALAGLGVTAVWLPPPTDSVSPEGYLPRDLYCLDSAYGSARELRRCVAALQAAGLLVLGDAVLNHRCASSQGPGGLWNSFGGRLAWDARAIVGDDANFAGRGGPSSGERFDAAPNIDHSQAFVKRDICEWLAWLRTHAGFDGFRLDFVKGFGGEHVGHYMMAAQPALVVGEFWDALAYREGTPEYNQDAHRQRTIDWLNRAAGTATAFDVTTKGILHAVFERCEYWRLRDASGCPPGVMGWWPSRAVTFLENHDTGSTQGHWRFPAFALEQGYAYILTHPGSPCVFWDHLDDPALSHAIRRLIALRRRAGLHCRSQVEIMAAQRDVYAAAVGGALLVSA